MTAARTVKSGLTADERAVLIISNAAVPNTDPNVDEVGFHLQGAEHLHVYAEFGGAVTAASVTPWYWSDIAEQWYEGVQISFTAAPGGRFSLVAVQGENRVFFVADSVTGAGTLKLWACYSFSEPGRDG